jgi:hypothetical protein
MYSTCSFDETHVVLQTAHKLHEELHIKNVLMFDHSPAKNTQSLDLVSIKKKESYIHDIISRMQGLPQNLNIQALLGQTKVQQ